MSRSQPRLPKVITWRRRWRLFCMQWRYTFRDPYDVVGNRRLAEACERLEAEING